jgi:hypothetical protein
MDIDHKLGFPTVGYTWFAALFAGSVRNLSDFRGQLSAEFSSSSGAG